MKVTSVNWLHLTAFAAVIFHVHCDHLSGVQNGKFEDGSSLHDAVFGFRPCLDESCGNYPPPAEAIGQEYVPHGDEYMEENPRVHCIMLRPSAVNTFREIEKMHHGIADIKYRVLEDLIDHMYPFATLKLDNCEPAMKLIDFIILAGNSLKTRLLLQGGEDCIYKSSESEIGENLPSHEVSEMPCNPYVPGSHCPESTTKPEVPMPSTHVTEKPTKKPYLPDSSSKHPSEQTEEPCPDGHTTEKHTHHTDHSVITEHSHTEETEVIAEEECEDGIHHVGSLKGIPGVHYPNYTDIPITSFTCADKKCVPGFYADLETGCQVFHVCYEHRRESFLCPVGTIFNQPILACDYWYSSNCSLAPHYYDVNEKTELKEEKIDIAVEELLALFAEDGKHESKSSHVESDMDKITPFFPVKAVVTDTKPDVKVSVKIVPLETEEVASEIVHKITTKATKVVSSTRDVVKSIPEPAQIKPVQPLGLELYPLLKKKPMKMEQLLSEAVVPLAKAKLTTLKTAVPVVKSKFATKLEAIPAFKVAATPLLAKPKISALPIAKVAASKAAVKSSMPALKVKMVAPAVPLAKSKTVPFKKAKAVKSAATPFLKAKMLALPLAKSKLAGPVPLAKVKLAKAAAISPLTKKALALGYMKLLKAKKLALMG